MLSVQYGVECAERVEHRIGARVVTHGADSPDAPVQRSERGADFNTEIMKQLAADSFAVRDCLQMILYEEREHRLYAERDLDVLESPQ